MGPPEEGGETPGDPRRPPVGVPQDPGSGGSRPPGPPKMGSFWVKNPWFTGSYPWMVTRNDPILGSKMAQKGVQKWTLFLAHFDPSRGTPFGGSRRGDPHHPPWIVGYPGTPRGGYPPGSPPKGGPKRARKRAHFWSTFWVQKGGQKWPSFWSTLRTHPLHGLWGIPGYPRNGSKMTPFWALFGPLFGGVRRGSREPPPGEGPSGASPWCYHLPEVPSTPSHTLCTWGVSLHSVRSDGSGTLHHIPPHCT